MRTLRSNHAARYSSAQIRPQILEAQLLHNFASSVDLNGGRAASAKATAIARVDAPMNETVSSVAIAGFPVDWREGYLIRVR